MSEIIAIMDEVPLGRFKHEIGLKLRQALFLNVILLYTEVWHYVFKEEINMLESISKRPVKNFHGVPLSRGRRHTH